MFRTSTATLLMTVLLAACAPEAPTGTAAVAPVTIRDVPEAKLAEATGMPGTAIATASIEGNRVTVIYRADQVTEEQLAAAPTKICAYGDRTVFSAETGDLPDHEIAEGLKRINVTCG